MQADATGCYRMLKASTVPMLVDPDVTPLFCSIYDTRVRLLFSRHLGPVRRASKW
jgi:hypothetical protein